MEFAIKRAMKMRSALLVSVLTAVLPVAGFAATFTFTDTSLTDLAHGAAYTWGLSGTTFTNLQNTLHSGQVVAGARLTISNLDDWTVEPKDVLYVNILNGVSSGNHSYVYNSHPATYDTSYGTDFFATTSTHLHYDAAAANSLLVYTGSYNTPGNPGTWSDPDTPGHSTHFNLVIDFTSANLGLLSSYLAADYGTTKHLGLGLGPDCHYYDTCVTLTIDTCSRKVPDGGATLMFLGSGLVALAAARRLFRRSVRGA